MGPALHPPTGKPAMAQRAGWSAEPGLLPPWGPCLLWGSPDSEDKSINARKRIEQVFGWIKQAAGLRQLKARGRSRVEAVFRLSVVAYSLIGLANLLRAREVRA
ncbi:transposase [Microcystis elabens FACHB-917]|nr:transposase [Microcystis elabens FACHB-917]